jgi:hypothetical protein
MKRNIVFTSRDPGAAAQLLPIIEQVKKDGRLMPSVVASGAALGILTAAGHNCIPFEAEVASSYDQYDYPLQPANAHVLGLIDQARNFLDALEPAILVTGQSSMGFGVDEIFMYAARTFKPHITTFTFFDFWGGLNCLGGKHADHLLVMDEFAARLTAPGRQCQIHEVGSPKHEVSCQVNVEEIRRQGRMALQLAPETLVISFFAQTAKIAGYLDNFACLVATLSAMERQDFKFIIKAHPKEPEETGKLVEYARAAELVPLVVTDPAENLKLLAASDIIILCSSLICLDHAYLSSAAADPIGCVIYLAVGEEIQAYMRENYGFVRNPLVQMGLGYVAETKTDLERHLADIGRHRGMIDKYFKASQKLKGGNAVQNVVNLLYQHAAGERLWKN